jgi:hypothetical protein
MDADEFETIRAPYLFGNGITIGSLMKMLHKVEHREKYSYNQQQVLLGSIEKGQKALARIKKPIMLQQQTKTMAKTKNEKLNTGSKVNINPKRIRTFNTEKQIQHRQLWKDGYRTHQGCAE